MWASRDVLTKMHFPQAEIDKIDIGLQARHKVLKSTKKVSRNIQKMIRGESIQPIFSESTACDICMESKVIGVAKLTSPEQRASIPSGQMLVSLGQDKDYMVVPPGVVIDYSKSTVYIVCGTCQLALGLKPTESGILIHEMREGHGFVDLDSIDKLIQEHKR